jgi:hypothetical protein
MIDPKTGLEVKDPAAANAGAGNGAGASAGAGQGDGAGQGGAGQGAGGGPSQVVDQEIEVTLANGQKVKVKTSDVVDENGVPFKNKVSEADRKAQEAILEAERLKQEGAGPGQARQPKPGEFVDPVDGEVYTEEDLNRMMMTGEGVKAQRIMLSQINVRKVVTDVVVENESKARTITKYPDLQNPQSIFFKRVAAHMGMNDLYGKPNGLQLAAAAVAEQLTEENVPFNRGKVGSSGPASQRNSQTAGGVQGGGDGIRPPANSTPELDQEGKTMAAKLGIDPSKMANRLEKYLTKKNNRRGGE